MEFSIDGLAATLGLGGLPGRVCDKCWESDDDLWPPLTGAPYYRIVSSN